MSLRPRRVPLAPGFTFIEILMATAVLAFAMIPVFGLMTTGMVRTDINVGHTNAVEIATGLMNQVLSEETLMSDLVYTDGEATFPDRGSPLETGLGSVAHEAGMNRFFQSGAWTTSTTETRVLRANGIEYHVQMWIRRYTQPADLNFGFYELPIIEYRRFPDDPPGKLASEFDRVLVLDEDVHQDYTRGYSPYSPQNTAPHGSEPPSPILTNPYATNTVVESLGEISEQDPAAPGQYLDFAKVWVRVSWGYIRQGERGRAKDLWLISFKANLQQ